MLDLGTYTVHTVIHTLTALRFTGIVVGSIVCPLSRTHHLVLKCANARLVMCQNGYLYP